MANWITVGEYEADIMNPLGHGEFGTAYTGRNAETKEPVSIKKIENKSGVDSSGEIKILFKLDDHPNIITLHSFEYINQDLWLVYEMSEGGDLNKYFRDETRGLRVKVSIAKQLCNALSYIHTRSTPILHCGIKPTDILTFPQSEGKVQCKLAGFGRARPYKGPEVIDSVSLNEYKSPECYAKGEWTLSVDVFALGMINLAMLLNKDKTNGLYPLTVEAVEHGYKMQVGQEMMHSARRGIPVPEVVDLAKGGTQEKKFKEVIKGMSAYEPSDRKTASECLTMLTELESDENDIQAEGKVEVSIPGSGDYESTIVRK